MIYTTTARALEEAFEHMEFKQISREDNTRAYILAKLGASTAEEQPIIDIEMSSVYKADVHMIKERES